VHLLILKRHRKGQKGKISPKMKIGPKSYKKKKKKKGRVKVSPKKSLILKIGPNKAQKSG
jgi:hypothetical protein